MANMPTDETPRLLTPSEAAKRLRVSRTTVWRMVRSGRLPAVKVGMERGQIRIVERELDDYILGREAQ